MQKNYLVAAFEQTAAERFPAQGPELLAAMHRRIEALRKDNAGASQELWAHLESQIMPGIAWYSPGSFSRRRNRGWYFRAWAFT